MGVKSGFNLSNRKRFVSDLSGITRLESPLLKIWRGPAHCGSLMGGPAFIQQPLSGAVKMICMVSCGCGGDVGSRHGKDFVDSLDEQSLRTRRLCMHKHEEYTSSNGILLL